MEQRKQSRLTENTLLLTKMSKLHMAMEPAPDINSSKSLDEIDLGLEGELEREFIMISL